jgi:hypothetical protein
MSPKPTLFAPLKKAVFAFFKHDVALRRAEGRVRLVLEDRPHEPKSKAPSRAEQERHKEAGQLSLARQELARVLDDDPRLRTTMRHLAFVEHALERKGWRGLYRVPLEVLQKALAQLEELVTNWSPEGLACLRSKMAVAVIDREHDNEADAEADAYRTTAVLENPPMVAAQAIKAAQVSSEDEDVALRAAYEMLGLVAPGSDAAPVEMQGDLGSRSAKGMARSAARVPAASAPADIRLRDLQT